MFDDTELLGLSQPFDWQIPVEETPWEQEGPPATYEVESYEGLGESTPHGATMMPPGQMHQPDKPKHSIERLDLPDAVRVYRIPADKIAIDSQYGSLQPSDLDQHDYYLAVVQPSVMFNPKRLVRLGLSLYLYPEGTIAFSLLPENQKQSREIMTGKLGLDLGAAASMSLAAATGIKLPEGLLSAEVEFPFKWESEKVIVRVAGVQTRKPQWEIADKDIAGAFAANIFLSAHKGEDVMIGVALDGKTQRYLDIDNLPRKTRYYRLSDGHADPHFNPFNT